MLSVLADIAKAAVGSGDLYWIPDRQDAGWSGYVSFVLRQFLSPYKVVVEPSCPAKS
jgi:hypothetical protein